MKATKRIRRNNERGVAMIMAILAVALLAIIGSAFMYMADTENSVNGNYKSAQKAYFASRGGLQNVRSLLLLGGPLYQQASVMPMPTSGANTGVIYVFNGVADPTTISGNSIGTNPTLDDELCHEQFTNMAILSAGTAGVPCGSDGGVNELMAAANYFLPPAVPVVPAPIPYSWVRITNKQNFMGLMNKTIDNTQANGGQVCWDGSNEFAIPANPPGASGPSTCLNSTSPVNPYQTTTNPVLVLTSLGITPGPGNSSSRRITQMEVAFDPPVLTNAAIDAQAPVNLQGKLNVSGYDNCNCTATGASKPGRTCNNKQLAVYSGQPLCGNNGTSCGQAVTQTGNAATLLSAQGNGLTQYNQSNGNVNTQGATGQGQWNYNIPQLIQNYSGQADPPSKYGISCQPPAAGATYPTCSTPSGSSFGNYPTGMPDTPTYGPGQGPTTAVIPGSTRLDGNVSGSGVLIVEGDLEVHGGLDFYGLIIVQGEIKFTGGGSPNVNVYGAILAGEDVNAQDMAITDTVGGSYSFQYDSCALSLVKSKSPPRMLTTHEIMF